MNNVSLVGRVTKNIEVRKTGSGKSYSRFTLAVPRVFNKDETDFINCIAWGKTADLLGQYVHKGDRLGIRGFIQTGKYDSNGRTTYTFDVVADNIEFLSEKGSSKPAEPEPSTESPDPSLEIPEDDLPF